MIFSRTRLACIFMFSALISGSIGSVFSMEEPREPKELYFGIDEQKIEKDGQDAIKKNVELCLNLGIKLDCPEEYWLEQDILDLLPQTQREEFEKIFALTQQDKKSDLVSCSFNGESLVAKIIPLFGKDNLKCFFVKISENIMSSAEQDNGRLYFGLEDNRTIVIALADGMKFLIPEDEFLGKDILCVLPDQEKEKVEHAFNTARELQKPVEVGYTLKEEKFIAKIIPLTGKKLDILMSKKFYRGFFVEVRQG